MRVVDDGTADVAVHGVAHADVPGAALGVSAVVIDDPPNRDEVIAPAAPVATEWKHLPALDGLRAAAVIAVLIFHGGYLQGGFLGVDLFFALSGFLITSLLIRDATSTAVNGRGIVLGSFWGRRFRRLLPAVFTMVALVALWSWLFGSGADLAGVQDDGPWAVLYLANWHNIAESGGYWESFAQPAMFDHLWSLAIEEQFYLLWPLVLLAIWKWSKRPTRTLVIVSATAVAVSLLMMILLYDGVEPTRVYMGTDTRAASLLVGALAATEPARRFASRIVARLGNRVTVVVAALVVFVGWSWVAIDGASSAMLYRGGMLAHSLACAVIISLVVALDRGWLVRGFGWRPLVWVGVMSYGLYLWHWPIYTILSEERTGLDGLGLLALRLAVSVAIAYASFRIVEDPIRRRASWALGRTGLAVLVASVVGLSAFLFLLPEPAVEIAEFDPTAIAIAPVPTLATTVAPATTAAPSTTGAPAPRDSNPTDGTADGTDDETVPDAVVVPPTAVESTAVPATTIAPLPPISSVLWAGDSVAYDLAPAVVASLTAAGLQVDDLDAYPGFRLISPERSDIDLSIRVPRRAEEVGADLVLMQISNWDATSDPEAYRSALIGLSESLEPLGAKLIILSTPPTFDEELNNGHARLFAVAAALAYDGTGRNIAVLDSQQVWGPDGVIDMDEDGTPERKRDLIHVCPSGAARFGAWLAATLDSRFEGVEPGDPAVWADAIWVLDDRYDDPVGACAPL